MTIEKFIAQHGITMSCEWADHNPHMDSDEWARSATHYKCVLRAGRRRMTVYFSQGSAHTKEPDLASVLDCVASDVGGIKSARDFDEWASELGYDTDSRKAERTFKTIKKQAEALDRLLGTETAEALCFETERL